LTSSENNCDNFVFIGSAPINPKSKKYRLQFDIDSIPERDQVKAAEVRFTMINNTILRNEEFIHVIIHDIVQPGVKGISKPILRYNYKQTIIVSICIYTYIIHIYILILYFIYHYMYIIFN